MNVSGFGIVSLREERTYKARKIRVNKFFKKIEEGNIAIITQRYNRTGLL